MNKTKYIHLRGHYLSEGEVPDPCGGATIAFRQIEEIEDVKQIEYYIAKCYYKDHFNKKLGRLISGGRLNKGQGKILNNKDVKDNKSIVKALIEEFYQSEEKEGNQEIRLFVK